jgi:RND family efflux transporter MFP subunit
VAITPPEPEMTNKNAQILASQRGIAGSSIVKAGVFIVVATLIAVGGYFGTQAFLLDDDATTDDRRAVAVQRGTLLDDVTASGSVSFPELESLRFDISGTVAELLVREGDEVTEGQQLILLDQVTISALESAVANAEQALRDAGEDLAELLGGVTDLERAVAASNLADARVASMNAAEALAEFTMSDGTDSPAIVTAKEELRDANEALAEAVSDYEEVAKTQSELVDDAQIVVDDAAVEYSGRITAWFGSGVTESDQALSPGVLFENWGVTVDQIVNEAIDEVESQQDDPSTPWNENILWIWTHLSPFPVLTNCDVTSDNSQFRCPSAEIDDAWDVKVTAEESLAEVFDIKAAALEAEQVLIDAAQAVVESAAEDIVETINDIEINALAATLAEKIELEKDSEATLTALNDLDSLEIKLATAAVNQANAQLNNAKTELAGVNLVAPFGGVVTSISVEVGDPVNRTTPTIDILDPSVVIVDGSIDEIDVLSLRVGDNVTILLDALPDQPLIGVIDEIGDGVNQQGVIEFPLTISLTPPDNVELIEGLSATATIVINQIDNALLIPLQAIGGSFTVPTVDVVTDTGHVTTPITLGASDDFWVIVESGLTEGQEVLMTVAESVDPFQEFFGGGNVIRVPGGGAGFTGAGGGGRRPTNAP